MLEFARAVGDSSRGPRTTPGDAPMSSTLRRLTGLAVALLPAIALAQPPDLAEYRTAEQAIAAKDVKGKSAAADQPGFLGLCVEERDGKVIASEVAADSPAAKAGLKRGELLVGVDGKSLTDAQ